MVSTTLVKRRISFPRHLILDHAVTAARIPILICSQLVSRSRSLGVGFNIIFIINNIFVYCHLRTNTKEGLLIPLQKSIRHLAVVISFAPVPLACLHFSFLLHVSMPIQQLGKPDRIPKYRPRRQIGHHWIHYRP